MHGPNIPEVRPQYRSRQQIDDRPENTGCDEGHDMNRRQHVVQHLNESHKVPFFLWHPAVPSTRYSVLSTRYSMTSFHRITASPRHPMTPSLISRLCPVSPLQDGDKMVSLL